NAYKIDLQGKYPINSTFNVADLIPFHADRLDLRTNPFKGGGNDATEIEPASEFEQDELNQLEELSDIEEDQDELIQMSDIQGKMDQSRVDGNCPNHSVGSDMIFSAQTDGDKDPFALSKGPITREQTSNLRKTISSLVYSNPNSIPIEKQENQPTKLFNFSVSKIT